MIFSMKILQLGSPFIDLDHEIRILTELNMFAHRYIQRLPMQLVKVDDLTIR